MSPKDKFKVGEDRRISTFSSKKKLRYHVSENFIGALTCSCAESHKMWPFCEHIEKAIKMGHDGYPPGGGNALESLREMPDSVVVPIMPSEQWWVSVLLGPEEEGSRSVKIESGTAYRVESPGVANAMALLIEQPMLGYLGAGEGRLVIRSMVIEWLRSHYRAAPACKARIHKSIRWSKRDKHETPLSPRDYASLWCLVVEGKCRECLTFTNDLHSDAPVL